MSLDARGIDPQRLLPQSLEDRLLGWLGRCGGAVLFALTALTWLALVSWSVFDPSLTHATTEEARNFAGPIGAIVSDLLFQTLGFAAALALVPPLVWSVEMLRDERVIAGRAKLGFYPLAVLAVAGALSALPVFDAWPLRHGFGGLLGDGVFNLTARAFSLLNEQRASLASSVVLIAAALQMSGKAIGFVPEAVMRSFAGWCISTARQALAERPHVPKAAESPLQQSAVEFEDEASANDEPERSGWNWFNRPAESAPHAAAPVLPESSEPDLNDRNTRWLSEPPASVDPALPAPPVFSADAIQAMAASGSASGVARGTMRPGFVQAEAHASAMQSNVRPAPLGDFRPERDSNAGDDAPVDRGSDFDTNTDAASRAIAARFAPASTPRPETAAAAAAPAPQPAAPSAPVKGTSGILGGLARGRANAATPWRRPSLNMLKRPSAPKNRPELAQTVMRGNARLLEDVLSDFGIKGEVKDIRPGPVVTLYELEPSRGTKSSRVIGLAEDIARSMSVSSVRAAIVPGRNAIGLELPNARRDAVLLREILEADSYRDASAVLPLALGKAIGGEPVVADLARMPHLLVAGTTGSGKSVGINAMVLSLLYRHSPEDCRMLMIDPKMLELSVYNGIPHLLTPVITDPHKAIAALNWAVREMEERYKRMSALSVRSIDVFNNRVRNAKKRGEILQRTVQTGFDSAGRARFETQKMDAEPLPHIVVIVDEFADLMIVAGKEVEASVQRLAQMARAAGIHLIMATQRPSVDIITGTIKANFPTRISFKVTSKIDSRTILNEQGAEQLLGQGDMLYSTGAGQITRVHGAFVSDEEVVAFAEALRREGSPKYVEGITDVADTQPAAQSGGREPSDDDLYDRAVAIVIKDGKASTSYLQRRLSIGYNRAADLIEKMEQAGLITPANAVGKREILVSRGGAGQAA